MKSSVLVVTQCYADNEYNLINYCCKCWQLSRHQTLIQMVFMSKVAFVAHNPVMLLHKLLVCASAGQEYAFCQRLISAQLLSAKNCVTKGRHILTLFRKTKGIQNITASNLTQNPQQILPNSFCPTVSSISLLTFLINCRNRALS